MPSKEQAREPALYLLLLQVSVAPRVAGWWLKYAWMQMLRALMVPVRCQWGALPQLRVGRRVPMGAEQARFSPRHTLLGCKFVLVKKCQCRELSCLLWQSVEQERAPVPLSGLRCWKVYEPRATRVLWVLCCLFPGTTAAPRLWLCARHPCKSPTNLSNMFAKTGRERRREEELRVLSKRTLFSLVIYFS